MKSRRLTISIILFVLLAVSCSKSVTVGTTTPVITPGGVVSSPVPSEVPIEMPTVTSTSLPLALRVNGEGILLSEYQAEISRLQAALTEVGQELTPAGQKTRVLDNFTDELLLSQAAAAAGFTVSDADVQTRIDKMVADLGSMDKLTAWESTNGYTDESFRDALKREIAVAWQRDQIISGVPITAEQIHARQLLYKNELDAVAALNQLNSGVDFTTLAKKQDPILGGDLGWFPRGMLTQPEVEEAVFALQPGETTGVIASKIGYHIVNVIERDPAHPLSTEALLMAQRKALADWLVAERAKSTIEILVP